MKKIFIIPFLFLSISLNATIYWVTPRGNDSNAGTDSSSTGAWLTWHKAFTTAAVAQDTVYFRGGVYPAYSTTIGVQLRANTVNGTYSKPTCFFAYPSDFAAGNYPVLDCQIMTNATNRGLELSGCSNLYIKGLTVKNTRQTGNNRLAYGIYMWSQFGAPNNIKFENCTAHNNGMWGFGTEGVDTVYFVNCDAYNNCDSLTLYDPGGQGTGFALTSGAYAGAATSYTYLYGCRAWNNTDQGFEITTPGLVEFDHCISFHNGYCTIPNNNGIVYAKGSGWKFWLASEAERNSLITQLIIRNCMAVDNGFIGINMTDDGKNELEVRCHIYNNFVYRNGKYQIEEEYAWGLGFSDFTNVDTVGRWDHKYYNNVSYDNTGWYGWGPNGDMIQGVYNGATNFFDVVGSSVSDADFASLDTTGLCGARQADGSLPVTTFGTLDPTSELINAGTDVGLDYIGDDPDVGYAEYNAEEDPPATAPLVSTTIPTRINVKRSISGGVVTSDGGAAVSERGICWSTSANPTTANNKITSGTGEGAFTVTITGLSSNTTYHVRAYAINTEGTSYGADEDFTTPKWTPAKSGTGIVVNSEGKIIVIK